MRKRDQIYLLKPHVEALRIYCKGCQYFKPDKPAKDICSIVGWYNEDNIKEIVAYAKHCPCNEKCLVKAACTEEVCPIWIDYIKKAIAEKNYKLMVEKGELK